jgi:hypothetical protein
LHYTDWQKEQEGAYTAVQKKVSGKKRGISMLHLLPAGALLFEDEQTIREIPFLLYPNLTPGGFDVKSVTLDDLTVEPEFRLHSGQVKETEIRSFARKEEEAGSQRALSTAAATAGFPPRFCWNPPRPTKLLISGFTPRWGTIPGCRRRWSFCTPWGCAAEDAFPWLRP